MINTNSKIFYFLLAAVLVLGFSIPAQANMKIVKAYKEAYPDEKPKCIGCHVDAMPKKDGAHDPNDYGKALKAAAAEVTVDSIKKVGKIEDFKK
ncbi:MAG: hypothetical protein HQL15_00255 [Candidatus Omnitrophica bacterium]|nr:hypothetical protein [Candidatus Omnitrophota bacterium]